MHLSASDIFWKSWWSAVIVGAATGITFYAITSFFDWHLPGTSFVDVLIGLSIFGSYFGAGYVGWRIADKYYYGSEKKFAKYYRRFSLLTFVALVVIVFSPLSFLGLLWSLIPPWCVLQAIKHIEKEPKPAKKPRRKRK